MAVPLSADALVAALRAEGVKVVEHSGWRTNRRPASTGTWGPLNGVMIHHTVTSSLEATIRLCSEGRSDLPGPLCHGVIAKDGTVHLVGYGRANHAGLGDDDVLAAVVREDPNLPSPNENNTDGNARFYGFECVNLGDGKDPWPAAQLEAIEAASAAICRAHGWSARSVIGHKEWTNTKIDPRGVSMPGMRDRIADRLARPAGTATPTEEDLDMTPEQIYDAVWRRDRFPAPTFSADAGNATWWAENVFKDMADQVRAIDARTAAQGAAIEELARTVAQLAADRGQDVDVDALVARVQAAIDSIRITTSREA